MYGGALGASSPKPAHGGKMIFPSRVSCGGGRRGAAVVLAKAGSCSSVKDSRSIPTEGVVTSLPAGQLVNQQTRSLRRRRGKIQGDGETRRNPGNGGRRKQKRREQSRKLIDPPPFRQCQVHNATLMNGRA